jgi:hypothetical protein
VVGFADSVLFYKGFFVGLCRGFMASRKRKGESTLEKKTQVVLDTKEVAMNY